MPAGCAERAVTRFEILVVVLVVVLIVGRKVRIEFLENFVAGSLDIDVEALEHAGGDAFALAEQAEENVLRADVANG